MPSHLVVMRVGDVFLAVSAMGVFALAVVKPF